ncbi:hypothetical protein [Atlantibacter hermannii]|uniref:hypothetical protein n=1 Tax=Atlantibacter hermannii TaxID=565 RepID=UPI0022B77E70|nr:hypothetical protein [Atlantibacter hermannii]MCZ7836147.1 hypothetical protein [Atlantibacter hermannii]
MRDVMLFGEGWNGEVRKVADGVYRYYYTPEGNDRRHREAVFSILEYRSFSGKNYWIGFPVIEPSLSDIEWAIMKYQPAPVSKF